MQVLSIFNDLLKILQTSEYRNYLFDGFIHTIIMSLFATLIGLVLGAIIAIIKVFAIDNKYLKIPAKICNIYTTIIRGTPVALQLVIFVFVILAIPGFKPYAAIITFGINSSAYVSESIRAGIMSVDKGQMEAGRSLGLTKLKTMIKIIFPQAIKNVIPSIGNEIIALVKETSIISIVGSSPGNISFELNEAVAQISKGLGGNYLAPALYAGMLYLLVVYTITIIIKIIERRLSVSDKR